MAMNENYISWNMVNWITVILMVAIGMTVIAGAASMVRTGLGNA